MPPRKPRRDPKKTAEAFEALYFPEIMDRIFELAPYDSLLALRSTCKGFKAQADLKLVFHVVHTHDLRGMKDATPWGPIPHKNWQKTTMKKEIRILDLFGPAGMYIPAWACTLAGPITVRQYCRYTHTSIVFRQSSSFQMNNYHAYGFDGHQANVTIAVDVQSKSIPWRTPDANKPSKSLTLIAIGIDQQLRQYGRARAPFVSSYGKLFVKLCDFLALELWHAHSRSQQLPVSLFNLLSWFTIADDAFKPDLHMRNRMCRTYSLWPEETTTLYRSEDQFTDAIESRLQAMGASSQAVSDMLSMVTFMSLDEYKRKVGIGQLRLQTELVAGINWGLLGKARDANNSDNLLPSYIPDGEEM